jgi:hypothetical protein
MAHLLTLGIYPATDTDVRDDGIFSVRNLRLEEDSEGVAPHHRDNPKGSGTLPHCARLNRTVHKDPWHRGTLHRKSFRRWLWCVQPNPAVEIELVKTTSEEIRLFVPAVA